MAAFNWIQVKDKCPKCGMGGQIRCQTHVASDYDGDERGRFHDRCYWLGDPMNWWAPEHEKYATWKVNGWKTGVEIAREYDRECCYSKCQNCETDLFVVLRFKVNVPIAVLDLGLEEDWPQDYYK